MKVAVFNKQKDLTITPAAVRLLVKSVIAFEKREYDEVAVYLIDQPTICRLHAEYFNDPSSTDCLSFPLDDGALDAYRMMGDLFVCPHTAIEYATLHGTEAYAELSLYLVHALLHLMGYDDIERSDRTKMRAAERRHLNHLKSQGLLLSPPKKVKKHG